MINKTFKKTIDFGVAKDMGIHDNDPISKFFFKIGILSESAILSKRENEDVDQGHVTRMFDWDGRNIWTPCDCELATNLWSADTGKFLKHVKGDTDESLATMYAYKCGYDDVIFGNGNTLLHANRYGDVKRIFDTGFSTENICVSKDGNSIFLLKRSSYLNDNIEITILERSSSHSDFKEFSIPIDKKLLTDDSFLWELELFETQQGTGYICMYARLISNENLETSQNIVLASLKEKRVINISTLKGIQCISKHPSENMLVVLGQELTVLSIPELKTIKSTKLPVTRDKEHFYYGSMSHSSCGRFLALSYAINGEVEVRDAQTLDILFVFDEGHGLPQPDISWDVTGRYLACRFYSRGRGYKPILVVWDTKSRQQVLQTESSETNEIRIAFRWSPYSTELACLVNNQRIQVFELV